VREPFTLAVVSQHPRERAAEFMAEALRADVIVVESMTASFARIRAAEPDMVIVCIDDADADTCRVLTMLSLDPWTRWIPVLTWTKAIRDPEPLESSGDSSN